ncbi:MAG TPA: GNAT family N-acetyltransferase [Acetobacteraceae bacterium]|nr:GNAT family N-acetyltransferase [Acetobacteraceae bacterium]
MTPHIRTARLVLRPVGAGDLADLVRLKADPLVFGQMLGGVRSPWEVAAELAEDVAIWARFGAGMFAIHEGRRFQGMTGVHERPDGRGLSLRFAVWPEARGRGVAREAASAALRHAHDQVGIARIVAVARADNFGSRMVLGAIGMRETDAFLRAGHVMLVYESRAEAWGQRPSA